MPICGVTQPKAGKPPSSSLRRAALYASLFGMSGALHLAVFEQPAKQLLFSNLLGRAPNSRCVYEAFAKAHIAFPFTA
jgi:hypothetical protein